MLKPFPLASTTALTMDVWFTEIHGVSAENTDCIAPEFGADQA